MKTTRLQNLLLVGCAAVALCGCGNDEDATPPAGGQNNATQAADQSGAGNGGSDRSTGMPARATYGFSPGLGESHPVIVALLERAFDSILSGDYQAYRRLIVTARDPEPEDRFRLIHEALREVTVTEIQPIDDRRIPAYDGPAYLVRMEFTLDPESRAARAIGNRAVTLLVLKDADDWRLAMAPAALQPNRAKPEVSPLPSAAEPPLPDYPWDENVDY